MVEVLERPRWTLGRYRESYAFELEAAAPRLLERIAAFFGGANRLRELVVDKREVRFSRGSWLGSVFSPWERHHRQRVRIRVDEAGELGAVVTCCFECAQPYPTVLLPPHDLEREVSALAAHLRGAVDGGAPVPQVV